MYVEQLLYGGDSSNPDGRAGHVRGETMCTCQCLAHVHVHVSGAWLLRSFGVRIHSAQGLYIYTHTQRAHSHLFEPPFPPLPFPACFGLSPSFSCTHIAAIDDAARRQPSVLQFNESGHLIGVTQYLIDDGLKLN